MSKPNFNFQKRQRELAKQKKNEEKRQRKLNKKMEPGAEQDLQPENAAAGEGAEVPTTTEPAGEAR